VPVARNSSVGQVETFAFDVARSHRARGTNAASREKSGIRIDKAGKGGLNTRIDTLTKELYVEYTEEPHGPVQ
jgi:hypothetical protein